MTQLSSNIYTWIQLGQKSCWGGWQPFCLTFDPVVTRCVRSNYMKNTVSEQFQMSLKYGLNFTVRYATSHIVKPFEFTYWSLVTSLTLWLLCDDEAMLPNQVPGKHKMSMTILMNLSHWRPSLYLISEDVFMRNLASRQYFRQACIRSVWASGMELLAKGNQVMWWNWSIQAKPKEDSFCVKYSAVPL